MRIGLQACAMRCSTRDLIFADVLRKVASMTMQISHVQTCDDGGNGDLTVCPKEVASLTHTRTVCCCLLFRLGLFVE